MHHVLVVVGEGRLASIGGVREVIVGGTIEIESRCQNECHLLPLLEAVNFAVDIEEKVALEGGAGGGNPVHPIECLPVGVEGRDLENILEQRYSGTRHNASTERISVFVLPLPISRSISEGNTPPPFLVDSGRDREAQSSQDEWRPDLLTDGRPDAIAAKLQNKLQNAILATHATRLIH